METRPRERGEGLQKFMHCRQAQHRESATFCSHPSRNLKPAKRIYKENARATKQEQQDKIANNLWKEV